MVKDKIKKALEDAVGYYNDGLSANEAVVKSASEHDLTIDQTDRVVEGFNTAKTINYFDKNASDRTGKFDLASKREVTLSLFGSGAREKKASALVRASDPDPMSSAFYASEPDRSLNRKSVFAEKRASALEMLAKVAEEKWRHGYSNKTLQDMASDAYSVVKSAEKDIDGAIGTIDDYLYTATEKIAYAITRSPYGTSKDKADLFKAACPHDIVIREVSKFCPLLKKATGGRYLRNAVIDTTPVDDILKEAEDIVEAVRMRSEYRKKKAAFHDKAERIKSAVLRDPSLSCVVASVKEASANDEELIHFPSREKLAEFDKASSGGKADAVAGILTQVMKPGSLKSENEQLRDVSRGAILADLLSSDPILQTADPRQVAAVYKSIIASSPRVSLNKEVVRSVLRGAVNSIAVSPADMKVLTDVEKNVTNAYREMPGDKGGSKDDDSLPF